MFNMSNRFHSNYRLLWSIVRAPASANTTRVAFHPTHPRFLSFTAIRQSSHGFSVSFGDPETDAMIAGKAENSIPTTVKKNKSKKKSTNSKQKGSTAKASKQSQVNVFERFQTQAASTTQYLPQEAEDAITLELPETLEEDHDIIPFSAQHATKSKESKKKSRSSKDRVLELSEKLQSDAEKPPYQPRPREQWQIQKSALQNKFAEGWNPRKKLSPDAIDGIKALHEEDPEKYSTPALAAQFKVSPEAIRRILKSRWRPSEEELSNRRERWARRHDRIWDQQSELGLRPRRRKEKVVDGAEVFEEQMHARKILEQYGNV